VLPVAEHWMSIITDDSVLGEETWTHLWVSAVRFPGENVSRLLHLAADYATAGVIIIITTTTADMSWFYHPYDGGADVIAATVDQRDQLRREDQEWLSAHPAGL
jgi:hypothetical protein